MLQNDFFTFTDLRTDGDVIKATIILNASHQIFQGHFPGHPVLPGVCMMQMVKEVTAHYTSKKIQLLKADHLKFLSFIDPRQSNTIRMELKIDTSVEHIKVEAALIGEHTTFFKFKGIFIFI